MVYPYTHSYSWKSPNDFWFRFTHPNHPQHGLNITGNFNYLIAQARTSIVLGQAIQLGTKDKVIFERGKEVLFEVYDATNYLLDRLHKEIVIYSFYCAIRSFIKVIRVKNFLFKKYRFRPRVA